MERGLKKLLRRCPNCNLYSLQSKCRVCHGPTYSPHPPKFSPDDRYLKYRLPSSYRAKDESEEKVSTA